MTSQGRASPFRDRDSRLDRHKFVVNEKTGGAVQEYHICDENGIPLVFVERPLLKLKGEAHIFDDETKTVKRLTLRQEKLVAINERFTLLDAAEQVICTYERNLLRGILRPTWHLRDPFGQEIARARETSWGRTLLRHIVIFGPFMRINFDISLPDGSSVGLFSRRSRLRENYELDLTADPTRRLDRRMAIGLAILLDARESV